MSILSVGYLAMVFTGILLFYLLPQKAKPYLILALSLIYVYTVSKFGIIFIVLTSLMVYMSALGMKKTGDAKSRKRILSLSVSLTVAVLIVLKYLVVLPYFGKTITFDNVNMPLGMFMTNFLYPAGLSYYTLQLISYLMDVYWGKIEAESSYGKVLIFTCYFPQMVQGPISKYSELAPEIFKEHRFEWKNLKFGTQLILWGMFKKFIIADRIGVFVSKIFYSGEAPYGLTVWVGLVYFGIQLYCDFGGGIDIIRGVSECFGIGMKENFRQPYFSRSLGEFWRRWHISLGEWMKDYVFYPVSISRPLRKIKKSLKKVMSRKAATRVGMGIADLIVFILVGVWHGTGTNFFGWGLYNGIILAVSAILAEEYKKWKTGLKIKEESLVWKGFTWIRTLIIITVGWIFDCADTLKGSLRLLINSFNFKAPNLDLLFGKTHTNFIIVLIGCIVLLVVSILREKGKDVRVLLDKQNYVVQLLVWTVVLQVIFALGYMATDGGFMYANF